MPNQDNTPVYELEEMFAVLHAAESTHGTTDLQVASVHIGSPSSVLEVGPGTGRCIDFFLKLESPPSTLTAIEVSDFHFNHLVHKYAAVPQVTIVHGSVLKDCLDGSSNGMFDCAIIMWSTFLEFSKEEQLCIFRQCSKWLRPGGKLVIDVSNPGNRGKVVVSYSEYIKYELFKGHYHEVYLPSPLEMAEYASASGLQLVASEEWLLQHANVMRTSYVFQKKD
ncbi:hypothetical protein AeMF1_017026 [Aphanomyces euteiches]|nr:hypothetical protein AeMF1_017026 [Aphanomyces euteiches]KAH9193497.1 hypothetical protein AeNC1_004529 [Aphanomyces euteiches]